MTKSNSDILTIAEVAEYLKVAERTLYRLAAAKKIPAFKVGGMWRFSRLDIDQWISQQSVDGSNLGRNDSGDTAKKSINGEKINARIKAT